MNDTPILLRKRAGKIRSGGGKFRGSRYFLSTFIAEKAAKSVFLTLAAEFQEKKIAHLAELLYNSQCI